MASQLDYLNGAPVVRAEIEGRPRVCLVNTGSSVSLVQPGVSASRLDRAIVTPFGVTGDELRVKGEQRVTFTINGQEFVHTFCVCNIATEADAILGVDFLRKADACVDFDKKELRLEEIVKLDHDSRGVEHCDARGTAARVALTVFTRPDSRGRKDSCMIGYKKQNEQLLNCTELSRSKIQIDNSEP